MSVAAATALWAPLGGALSSLAALRAEEEASPAYLPSRYRVDELAAASVAVATLGVAELSAARSDASPPAAHFDPRHASAAFRSERLVSAVGWQLPGLWDPIAGDYLTADSKWIRLHTNYAAHREAALRVLGDAQDRATVAALTATWSADALEDAVVAQGGCAAVLRSASAWAAHPQGRAVATEPVAMRTEAPASPPTRLRRSRDARPLAGVRVLDLTRVIAGPVATRFLAAYGAEVLRIDPPGFEEVSALLPDTTAGKRCAFLDLRAAPGRASFGALVEGADVLIAGLRPEALARLGLDVGALRALNPALVIVEHNAYGWAGPWSGRRGFDSLVQMSLGLALVAPEGRPSPLPCQALDHATGYLVAAAACIGLGRLVREGLTTHARLSLTATARFLMGLCPGLPDLADPGPALADGLLETAESHWGPLRRVRCPGRLATFSPSWAIPAGPLGRDPAAWLA